MHSQIIKLDYSKQKEHYHLLCSDIHFGNKGQNKKALKKDFDKARDLNANIYINGDWGDFILSGDRKRYTPSGDAYGTDNNVNMTINEAFDFFSEYSDLIKMIGTGNHEVSCQKFNNFDPTQQLIYSLNNTHKTAIEHGQYCGYLVLRYSHGDNGSVKSKKIFYNHGQGASAEVSKGTIDLNRHFYNKTCDILWLGHKHTKVLLPSEFILDVDQTGKIIHRERAGLITGAYMTTASQYDGMKKGYRINYGEERMRNLQSTGGIFVKHTVSSEGIYQEFIV